MQRAALLLLVPALYMAGCKTTGSKAKTFNTASHDPAEARALIIKIVQKNYKDQAAKTDVLNQFANGLIEGDAQQAADSDKVLQDFYDRHDNDAFDNYVTMKFLALTNYITDPGHLQYLGLPRPKPVTTASGATVN